MRTLAHHQLLAVTVLVAALTAAAVAEPSGHFAENFAQLDLVEGTLMTMEDTVCPFTAVQGATAEEAACGQSFTVHWSNGTSNEDGLREVELMQNGNALSQQLCADGFGTASGDGRVWLSFALDLPSSSPGSGSGSPAAVNVQMSMDEDSGTVQLTGQQNVPGVGIVEVCSAIYSLAEDDGLEGLLYWL